MTNLGLRIRGMIIRGYDFQNKMTWSDNSIFKIRGTIIGGTIVRFPKIEINTLPVDNELRA